ncbi:MAG: lipid-A-disaccharide synthase [Rickettsiales bacterium]|jgi:lipid-A-disaccharide synthase|nr:lipid-A-disaccharide synthase [Rickettsiales bacterium]
MKIFIIVGEMSGDLLGSKFMTAMHDFEFVGIGGEKMEKQGLKSLFNIKEINVMGVFEVLPNIFKINNLIKQTISEIEKEQPDIILTIDSPGFCFRVIKGLKNCNAKKVHLIAPSVWAWKEKRAKKISKMYDLLLCILPFEPPYFEKHGLSAKFIGHPIFDDINEDSKQNVYHGDLYNFILTPGSRKGEVSRIFPIMIEAINILKKDYDYDIETNIFATKNTETILKYIAMDESFNCNIVVNADEKTKILKQANFAIAKSGTNTFEFNIHSVPLVVVYTMNYLTNKLGKLLIKIKFANLVNIIAGREIIPEFIGDRADSDLIAEKINELLKDGDLTKKQIAETKDIIKELGYLNGENAAEKGANEIRKLLQ